RHQCGRGGDHGQIYWQRLMKKLAILGASGHGKVVADCAELCGWESVSFFDDAWPATTSDGAWSIEGDTQLLTDRLAEFDGVLVAVVQTYCGDSKLQALLEQGAQVPGLVHPPAIVSRDAEVGAGEVLFAGAVVNMHCRIAMGVIINTDAPIDHDCVLEDAVQI